MSRDDGEEWRSDAGRSRPQDKWGKTEKRITSIFSIKYLMMEFICVVQLEILFRGIDFTLYLKRNV